jgi:hypothetical protein
VDEQGNGAPIVHLVLPTDGSPLAAESRSPAPRPVYASVQRWQLL